MAAERRNQQGVSRVSSGVVTHLRQTIDRRPVLDLAVRAIAIGVLALLILVGLPALASAGT